MSRFGLRFNEETNQMVISAGSEFAAAGEAIFKITSPYGEIIHQNSGYSDGDFSSPDVDGSTSLTLTLDTDTSGKIVNGGYTLAYQYNDGTDTFTIKEIVSYCFTPPTPEIQVTHDCYSSEIELEDLTDYSVSCSGSTLTPYSTLKELRLKYPENIEAGTIDDVTTASSVLTVSPIYTQNWQGSMSTDLVYSFGDDDSDFESTISCSIYDHENEYVKCSDCLCSLYLCISQLFNSWMNVVGKNPSQEKIYQELILKLLVLYNKYYMAERCGKTEELSSVCEQITAVVNLTGCVCCSDEDEGTYSTKVIPVGTSSTTSSGSTIYQFSDTPSNTIGNDGDWGFMSEDGTPFSEGDAVYKEDGEWTFSFSTIGATGADGDSSGVIVQRDYTIETDSAVSITLDFGDTNELTKIGDRATIWAKFNLVGELDAGSQILFVIDPTGVITEDVESTDSDTHCLYLKVELRVTSNFTGSAIGLDQTVEISRSNGEYSTTVYNERGTYSNTGWSVKITPTTNGSGSIEYCGYDVKFNGTI